MTNPIDLERPSEGDFPLWKRVVRLHRANPTWGAARIAHAIGRSDAYVRATAQRHDLDLPRSRYAEASSHGAEYAAKRRESLAHLRARITRLEEALSWIAGQSDLFFAECSLAEEIVERAARALLTNEGQGHG